MKNIILKTECGNDINTVAESARSFATEEQDVEFMFNDIKCIVGHKTVVEWLVRDYMNAHIMEWKTVGPDCKMMYDNDTEIELRVRQLARARRWKQEAEERRVKEEKEKSIIDNQIEGVSLEIIVGKEDEYKQFVDKNSQDGYSRAVVVYAETWGKLMQVEIALGKSIIECADYTQKGLGYLGISGFQYGCVVQSLSAFWKHGEELRRWHNKQYGVSEEKKGVVNPAVLTIGK